MTKVWCQSAVEEEYTEARIVSEQWFGTDFSVFDCKPAPWRSLDMTLELRWGHPPADFFEPGTVFTVSNRLKQALDEFRVQAEYFPLRVLRRGREYTERTFYFCNILIMLECFDLKRGAYTFCKKRGYRDYVDKIKRLAIDEGKAAGHDLFRIAKGGEGIVCVSDRVASRIAEGGFTGVRLVEPQDWQYGCVA
jgi:hypothetical protein